MSGRKAIPFSGFFFLLFHSSVGCEKSLVFFSPTHIHKYTNIRTLNRYAHLVRCTMDHAVHLRHNSNNKSNPKVVQHKELKKRKRKAIPTLIRTNWLTKQSSIGSLSLRSHAASSFPLSLPSPLYPTSECCLFFQIPQNDLGLLCIFQLT